MKQIHVAAAAIVCAQKVLLSRRHEHAHQGGKWEFPGGKVESGEAVVDALARELKEELDISPTSARPLIRVHHRYPDLSVLLDVWKVEAFEGEPRGCEGQLVEWMDVGALMELEFPDANLPIVKSVQMPERLTEGDLQRFEEGKDYVLWGNSSGVDWDAFQAFTEQSKLPVYVKANEPCEIARVWKSGGQGIVEMKKAEG